MSDENEVSDDTITPLDSTLEKIGMGYYQWSLLGLCGFGVSATVLGCSCSNQRSLGWLTDNVNERYAMPMLP